MALDLGWGWKGALFSWTGLIILGILFWIPQIRNHKVKVQTIQEDKAINVWKSRLAWQISTFMGVQSLMFFTLIAWLPDMLISRGLSEVEAGLVLSLMQIIGLSASFLAPIVGVKFKDQVPLAWSLGGLYLVGFSSLFSQTLLVNYIGLSLVGIATGASLSFAYMIIGLRTQSDKTTASLSGMAQSTGYYLAALGPLLFGLAFDIFGNWDLLIYLMLFCTVLFVFFGVKSGRARVIGFEVQSDKIKSN
jgi:CP family cyanate transporter-like MFS transporter